MSDWTFLTNHAQVFLCIADNPRKTAREIADEVGITERAVQRLIRDLVDEGYIKRFKTGRRNRYELNGDRPMRHPRQYGHKVGELLDLLDPAEAAT